MFVAGCHAKYEMDERDGDEQNVSAITKKTTRDDDDDEDGRKQITGKKRMSCPRRGQHG